MTVFLTKEAYIEGFQGTFEEAEKRKSEDLKVYLNTQIEHLEILVEKICKENFWKVWPEILGIDSKLGIVSELVGFEDFLDEDIIRIVETDYRTYFKELSGYDLSTEPKHSMIFNIL